MQIIEFNIIHAFFSISSVKHILDFGCGVILREERALIFEYFYWWDAGWINTVRIILEFLSNIPAFPSKCWCDAHLLDHQFLTCKITYYSVSPSYGWMSPHLRLKDLRENSWMRLEHYSLSIHSLPCVSSTNHDDMYAHVANSEWIRSNVPGAPKTFSDLRYYLGKYSIYLKY